MRRHIVALLILILLGQSLSNLNSYNYNNDSLDSQVIGESTLKNATLRLTDIDSPNIIDIFAGGYNSCFVNIDDEFYCWGEASNMQLGVVQSDTHVPVLIDLGSEVLVEYSSSTNFACGLTNLGKVYCWGDNDFGRTGIGLTVGQIGPTPLSFDFGLAAIEITASQNHACALMDNNYVSCWGMGNNGRNGQGTDTSVHISEPQNITIIPDGLNATSISGGLAHTCAILSDDSVLCWGVGTIGSNSGKRYYFGNLIPTSIKSGDGFSCVLLDDYSVNCWGENHFGTLGINSTVDKSTPQEVNFGNGRTVKSIDINYRHICAILVDNTLQCWGANSLGALGTGDTENRLSPTEVEVPLGRILKSVKVGHLHTCVLFADSSIDCFGRSGSYELGIPSSQSLVTLTISKSLNSINTPLNLLELTENKSTNLTLRSQRSEMFRLNDYQYNLDLPNGLAFNNGTFIISGIPQYTNQVNWNFSIGNGSVYYNGTYQLQILSDTDGDGIANKYDDNDDDDPWFDELDGCPIVFGNSTWDVFGCIDSDGDGYSDQGDKFPQDSSQQLDSDQDGYGDNTDGNLGDDCPRTYGTSNRNSTYGCEDSDFDGWADFEDEYVNDSSQWKDTDGDGYGDELNGFQGDACPKNAGSSTLDRFGCRDTDKDGWSDNGDALPENPTQWLDRDGDGYGDNDTEEATEIDLFPSDGTQWNDTDGDGHGDNPYGTQGDWFPSDPTRWMDSDRDGVADDDDLFDNDATQWDDRDGDGYGDETNGNRPDAFPDDPLEWKDTDDDGIGDNSDDLPFNPSQTNDRDGDGFGDDIRGTGADPFPDDPTQWLDADGDGYGDNIVGNEPDLFPRDITQWFDIDGDGYGDNPNGVNPDAFPDDSTQWVDDDGDGFGDNPNGTNPDPSINDYDNDGYLDNDDPFPQTSSPGDKDNDNVLDEDDAFPSNFREFSDNDADGIGDIEDLDDDNDGYLDEDELRSGSDSLDANSMPVEGFEIIIPGTSISLGAWDLIGIFGGVPLFGWIGFGFVTRNKRCARYEDLLNSANTRDELEKVALRWEYSLMLRMLGPHQGIRLERLRAELDDKFENATYDETEIGYDQTNIVENEGKDIPAINETSASPAKDTPATSTDESGYEWFKQEDGDWYRPAGSNDDWLKLEN